MFDIKRCKQMDILKNFLKQTNYVDIALETSGITMTEEGKELHYYEYKEGIDLFWGTSQMVLAINEIEHVKEEKEGVIIFLKNKIKIILKKA